MHKKKKKKVNLCTVSQRTSSNTGSSQRKINLFTAIPTVICPRIPGPHRLGRPSSPPIHPILLPPQEPRCPLIWSDTTTYPRQRSSQSRLSYPRVPVVCSPLSLCSYGSVTIEQSHMGAPLQRLPNPQWSHRKLPARPLCAVCCSFVEPEGMRCCKFQLLEMDKKEGSVCDVSHFSKKH